jgi:hypothetical protein
LQYRSVVGFYGRYFIDLRVFLPRNIDAVLLRLIEDVEDS